MHPLKQLSNKNNLGIYAACSGNNIVIEAVLKRAKETSMRVLIESTSNQVNQYGGYTGMRPADFREFVYNIADSVGYDKTKIVLAGDHLGPLIWTDIEPEVAMQKAEELVYEYVLAGFTKIHLDTSMKLKGDDSLSDLTIAKRSMRLAIKAEEAFEELVKTNPEAVFPVFVVGSEVPIPGGSQEEEESVSVTSTVAFKDTVDTFEKVFLEAGLDKTFNNIIAVVVQPGVEFGDEEILRYDREKAQELTQFLKSNYSTLVFEGHSSDYQTREAMKEMVEDGISILKVGPGLTFALREALFSLSFIENEMFPNNKSDFVNLLDEAMLEDPSQWKKHYHGDENAQRQKRKYSFSDRARYYLGKELVENSIIKLIQNFDNKEIPLNLISQYFPKQYLEIIEGKLSSKAYDLVLRHIEYVIDDYTYATKQASLK